jgi:uroporphyrinogen decarboxylase
MSTPRQRMVDAIEFNTPDKIPVVYHPSPAGLYAHGKQLLDLFNDYPPDNPVKFISLPIPPVGTVDHQGNYHKISRDEWGTEWEYLIYGIQGHPRAYPFESWEAAAEFQFPPFSLADRAELEEQRKEYLVFAGWISIFEKLHALRPIDQVLIGLLTEEPALSRFLDRLVEYWLAAIHHMIDANVDVIMFGDDWGTQTAPLISPALFQRLFKPRYEILMAPIRKAGKKIFFHSCGFLGSILDDLIDLGINGLWPQITFLELHPSYLEKCREHKVAIYIHPDRQYLVPQGSPKEIETAIKRYAERYHDLGGGGLFYIEIENDAPFENVKALIQAVHRWR